ncbi:hypothetical protein P43SY_006570 [Pythium insidiosum]|uniref:Secreted protein n=1 Tax=Pythium insidiosum TaxID=114742 RepID=A0AAD5LT02_PYTIN|nr:hypothetical protein P43SY_006570 [Pythium insidiosum]
MQLPATLAAIALAVAASSGSILQTASAATTYRAVCVFNEPKCGGSIQLRNYKPEPACENADCAAISEGNASSFSVLPTCTTDIADDTDKHLRGKPYVLVQNYKAGASCAGDAESAIAIVTDGKCYPSSDGKSSHKATMADDMAVTWMQYTDAACGSTATEVSFKPTEVDGKMCVKDTMKVLAVDGKMCVKDTMKVLAVKAGATKAPMAPATGAATPAPSATSGAASMMTVASAVGAMTAMASLALVSY